ncbi:MAG: hypothetical protein DME23_08115 [Verrucomicrobia bacterium]|nr:MAG: hypothetical protein DME23_08115 [Verrucomicrobiota bacterium]
MTSPTAAPVDCSLLLSVASRFADQFLEKRSRTPEMRRTSHYDFCSGSGRFSLETGRRLEHFPTRSKQRKDHENEGFSSVFRHCVRG